MKNAHLFYLIIGAKHNKENLQDENEKICRNRIALSSSSIEIEVLCGVATICHTAFIFIQQHRYPAKEVIPETKFFQAGKEKDGVD
jgi:hypothetical protein